MSAIRPGVFETVPNISEGRDPSIIDAFVLAAESAGARVLHRTSDPIHNRSVLTIAGSYENVREAGIALAGVALERIDLTRHRGVHPRIGALDVLPFIPLEGASMEDAARMAREAAAEIWKRYAIPSFLYGKAAARPEREHLADVRRGEFEGLDARFTVAGQRPDYGDVAKHASAGAIAIGARRILIAFNVELMTGDLAVAKRIAKSVRGSDGGLRGLKALGLKLDGGRVQVSLNVTDYQATPLYRVVELIRTFAAREKVAAGPSELIGCLPMEAVTDTAAFYLGCASF
ncbi:MAG: glutamate formimidoyltransferase [Candidatus Eremiobacteraeota bacterium]|nr:glutamate formimidoyltransferase [Candidatus Eremiobacteraeota bacterium]